MARANSPQFGQNQFLAKSIAAHGVRYDYSQVIYYNSKSKVKIICLQHGVFEQEAGSHMAGSGCPACAKEYSRKVRLAPVRNFITKAQAAHGNLYDYSQVNYTGAHIKVKIICRKHGLFEQIPCKHVAGCGCPKCGKENMGAKQMLGVALFIAKANAVHGVGKYDYSHVVYRGNKVKVRISCPQHGIFEQKPNSHLTGRGSNCPGCARQKTSDSGRLNTAIFVARAREAHGMRYDYSHVNYHHGDVRVKIICPQHGEFMQAPKVHANGHGCPKCTQGLRWTEKVNGRNATLYLLRIFNEIEVFFKVGVTYLTIQARYFGKQSIGGYDYEVLATHVSPNALAVYEWEQSILETFAHLKYRPLQRFGGETECFSRCEEILSIFPL